MKRILIIVILLTSFISVKSQDATQVLDSASIAFNSGDFKKALNKYEQLLNQGYSSAALFYNLGNTHYRLKNIPESILFYEKAMKLDPSDEDIAFNLAIANQRVVDKIEEIPDSFIATAYKSIRNVLTLDGWTMLNLIAVLTAFLAFSLYLLIASSFGKQAGFIIGTTAIIVLIFGSIMGQSSFNVVSNENSAIVFETNVTIMSGPNNSTTELFGIHSGTKVLILEAANDWYKIKLANGSIGWLAQTAVQTF